MEQQELFNRGVVEVTSAAALAFSALGETPETYVARHQAGDWGSADQDRRASNEFGVRYGHNIVSLYQLQDGTAIRVETSEDRSTTRVLLAAEYVPDCHVSVQEGYAIWSTSYEHEHNPLIALPPSDHRSSSCMRGPGLARAGNPAGYRLFAFGRASHTRGIPVRHSGQRLQRAARHRRRGQGYPGRLHERRIQASVRRRPLLPADPGAEANCITESLRTSVNRSVVTVAQCR